MGRIESPQSEPCIFEFLRHVGSRKWEKETLNHKWSQKNESWAYFTSYTKIKPRSIKSLNVKRELEPLEENVGENLADLKIGKSFLNKWQKHTTMKGVINKSRHIKMNHQNMSSAYCKETKIYK